MDEAQARGKVFEEIVKYYLKQHGYEVIPKYIRNYYGVNKKSNGINVKGRGEWHQIDALGQFQFQIPFVYPIRLISEVKAHGDRIGLPIVRNFVGVLKDISENYFIEKYNDLRDKDRFRFTDCGVIFSTSGFTKGAQKYAYAQGIYLIPMKEFSNLVSKGVRKIKKNETNFNKFIRDCQVIDTLDGPCDNRFFRHFLVDDENLFCYFGLAAGFYPIAIVSEKNIPEELFYEKDEEKVRIYYNYEEETREIYYFGIKFKNWSGRFQLPRFIWEKHMKKPEFRKEMRNMKKNVLNYIDVPMKIKGMRRIIRLKLDKPWIDFME